MTLHTLRIGAILCLCLQMTQAQQLPLFTQYREFHSIVNPATINSDYLLNQYHTSIGASVRAQWLGLERGPRTYVLRGEHILNSDNFFKPVLGGYLLSDNTGPTGYNGVYARIATIGTDNMRDWGFSGGLNIGATQFHLNATEVFLRQPNDVLTQQNYQRWYPDIGLGLFAYTALGQQGRGVRKNTLYGGLSIPQVFGLNLEFRESLGSFGVKRVPHFYGLMGYYQYLPSGSFIESSIWIKYVPNVPAQVDFNLRYQMGEYIWLGAGYSTSSTLHAEIGFLLGENIGWSNSNFKIGYGFDQSYNTVSPYFGAAHEINLSVTLGGDN